MESRGERLEIGLSNKTVRMVMAVLSITALLALAGWYRDHQALGQARAQLVDGLLQPAAGLVRENQALMAELRAEPYTEKDNGILESYLVKIRRDGVAKAAPMKQKLDQLAENNTVIVALFTGYLPNARTAEFTAQTSKFRDYASAWRDRWNSVMELFMAGGNYASSGVPFPKDFPEAVRSEIAAAR